MFHKLEGGSQGKTIHCVIEDDSETEKQAEADDNFDIKR